MASSIANGPGVPMVTRGRGTNIGTLPVNASTTVVQFTVSQLNACPNGLDGISIVTAGGTVGTPVLEASIDGGVTWFSILVSSGGSSSMPVESTTTFGGDTASSSANSYAITSLSGLTLFRFGAAVTVAPAVVWVASA